MIVTAINYGGIWFTIEELVRFDILDEDGRLFKHYNAARIVHAVTSDGSWQHAAAVPGRPR